MYARNSLSGEGAKRFGGRFNARGVAALYTSLSPLTAIRESNQIGNLQPTTLVAFDADIEHVFDARASESLDGYGMTLAELAFDGWRENMLKGGMARTQSFANQLIEDGMSGLLVRSFARGATEQEANLVLFKWGEHAPARLSIIDDESRLGSVSPDRSLPAARSGRT